MKSGMIRRLKDIHWDIRPHPGYGTLEIRVMDAASEQKLMYGRANFFLTLSSDMEK